MSIVYGYCRVSTKKQNIERQVRNIKERFPDAVIQKEAYTGTKIERPAFTRLLKHLKSGDTLVFDSISRMSRNADEGFKLYKELFTQGINLVFIKEPQINTETYKRSMQNQIQLHASTDEKATERLLCGLERVLNEFMLDLAEKQIQLAFGQAEQEVTDLHKRTSEGMLTAKLNGKQIGRIKGRTYTTKKYELAKPYILEKSKEFGSGALKDIEIMQLCNLSKKTYYEYKKHIRTELEAYGNEHQPE